MGANYTYYAIIIYIIIMMLFVSTKPQFIYDHIKNEYKGFGNDGNKTFFTLPVLAIAIAVLIAIFFCNLGNTTNNEKNEQIKYVPIPINYYPMMQQLIPDSCIKKLPDITSSLQFSSPLQHAFPMD